MASGIMMSLDRPPHMCTCTVLYWLPCIQYIYVSIFIPRFACTSEVYGSQGFMQQPLILTFGILFSNDHGRSFPTFCTCNFIARSSFMS